MPGFRISFERSQNRPAVYVGHHDIERHRIWFEFQNFCFRLGRVGEGYNVVALRIEITFVQAGYLRVIINGEDNFLAFRYFFHRLMEEREREPEGRAFAFSAIYANAPIVQ